MADEYNCVDDEERKKEGESLIGGLKQINKRQSALENKTTQLIGIIQIVATRAVRLEHIS